MDLRAQLIRDEGVRRLIYQDAGGALTIGVGHNCSTTPLSDAAIDQILDDDILAITVELETRWPFVKALMIGSARRAALINMAFNLGVGGLLEFRQMRLACEAGDWTRAGIAALESKWASQVGDRALRIARQLEEDTWV